MAGETDSDIPRIRVRNRKGRTRRALAGLLWVFLLLALDQGTKSMAYHSLRVKGPVVLVPGVLELQYLENRGAAFGIFQGRGWMFCVLAALIAAFAGYVYLVSPSGRRYLPLRIAMTGLIGGALGNLIDRAARGYVIDFIYFSLIHFPVFNVADICITLSVALLLILILFVYKDDDFRFLRTSRAPGKADDKK